MPLEDAQRFIADHPDTAYVILQRRANPEISSWSLLQFDYSGIAERSLFVHGCP